MDETGLIRNDEMIDVGISTKDFGKGTAHQKVAMRGRKTPPKSVKEWRDQKEVSQSVIQTNRQDFPNTAGGERPNVDLLSPWNEVEDLPEKDSSPHLQVI